VALLKIHVLGSPVLRQQTVLVQAITDDVQRLIDDMFETMYAAHGIGLAAPQVGRTERVAVIDVDGDAPFAIINPQIVDDAAALAKGEEGCLSIPDVYGDVNRPERVTVRALDRDGKEFVLEADGLLARCLQHEIDHLDGRLFVDHLSVLRRKAAMAKWATIKGKYPGYLRTLTAEEIAEHHHRDEEF
jgi:peptide deformylase